MKKEAVISIIGTQSLEDFEAESTEMTTVGSFYQTDGFYCVEYEESEITGLPDTNTVVRASDKLVSVTRVGKFPSEMIFEADSNKVFVYNTPYGTISAELITDCIQVELGEDGGTISLAYSINIDNSAMGHHKLCITVSTQSGS